MSNIHTFSDHAVVKGQFATAITAATNTPATAVDTLGFRRAFAVFQSAPSGTGTTSACKLQESDASGSGFVDVTNAAFTTVTTVAAAADLNGMSVQYLNIDLSKRKRYLLLLHTGAGGSAAGVAAGTIHLYEPDYFAPANDHAAVSV